MTTKWTRERINEWINSQKWYQTIHVVDDIVTSEAPCFLASKQCNPELQPTSKTDLPLRSPRFNNLSLNEALMSPEVTISSTT